MHYHTHFDSRESTSTLWIEQFARGVLYTMKPILLVASLVSAAPLSIARTERREEQAPMRAADLAVGSHQPHVQAIEGKLVTFLVPIIGANG